MAPSALYLLAAPSAPESAREEALLRAGKGEQITHRVAQRIVAAHKAMPASTEQKLTSQLSGPGNEESKLSAKQTSTSLIHRSLPARPALGAPELPAASGSAASELVGATRKLTIHFSSRTAEHYTPEKIIALALACLGEIDLDPCSEGGKSPTIPARSHYTVKDDGLAHLWHGRIYMNPPYGREIGNWVQQLCSEHKAGRVTEAIALLPSRTDTRWWRRLRGFPVCFVQGRLTFVGSQDPAPFPSAVFYLGQDIAKFCRIFGDLGDIYQRVVMGE